MTKIHENIVFLIPVINYLIKRDLKHLVVWPTTRRTQWCRIYSFLKIWVLASEPPPLFLIGCFLYQRNDWTHFPITSTKFFFFLDLLSQNMKNHRIFHLGFLLLSTHKSLDSTKKGKLILIPLYHFHPLHKHLDISRATTAGIQLESLSLLAQVANY